MITEIDKDTTIFDILSKKPSFNDLKKLLTSEPYNIIVAEDTLSNDKGMSQNLFLLKYNQIHSDFSYKLVRQCRGIIFDKDTYACVCYPMDKFFNYGESHAVEIDWDSAAVTEKIDGSLIKLWFSHKLSKWIISTNGTIDAYKAKLSDINGFTTFGELVESALKTYKHSWYDFTQILDSESMRHDTIMLEVVSPFNRVVVPYDTPRLFFLSLRNMKNLEEYTFSFFPASVVLHIEEPKKIKLSNQSLTGLVEMAKNLPFSEEGYVVVDKNFNRIKVKSPAYVAAHRLKNNGVLTIARLVEMIKTNETDEFVSYFPDYKKYLDEIQRAIDYMAKKIHFEFATAEAFVAEESFEDERAKRKRYAQFFAKSPYSGYLFTLLNSKMKLSIPAIKELILKDSCDKLAKVIEANFKINLDVQGVIENE